MTNILAVGIATIDIINTTERFPQEDDEVRAISQEIRRGGNATNTLVVLSQLGHQCEWIGCMAEDSSARLIGRDLDSYGIAYSHCEKHASGATPTSYITLNRQNGSRTIVHYRNLPELSAASFNKLPLEKFDWIHFEARNVEETRHMISRAINMEKTVPISIEIEKHRENLQALFTDADYYFFSKAFATSGGGKECFSTAEELLRHYRKLIPEAILVCTWGEKGAYALKDNQLYYSPAPQVDLVVDTIGAGDTFIAGFIHATLSKDQSGNQADSDLSARMNYACTLAAKKCAVYGFNNLN